MPGQIDLDGPRLFRLWKWLGHFCALITDKDDVICYGTGTAYSVVVTLAFQTVLTPEPDKLSLNCQPVCMHWVSAAKECVV
jgi:hypothetical protein